ncbi:MAG: hypothetical protein KDB96_19900, partial [Flavobacteriales bacterium]|nr:hypothetical protein [Flavobacteriales bacterium]
MATRRVHHALGNSWKVGSKEVRCSGLGSIAPVLSVSTRRRKDMKTKVVLAHALCGVCVLAAQRVGAEATVPGNFGGVGDYSGWNGNTAIPLEVRHNGNDHIQWFTDSIQRMQLYKTQTTWQIQDFNNIKQNGYLAISDQPLFFSQTVGPFSRLHLVDSC